jgi:hypothetical protein
MLGKSHSIFISSSWALASKDMIRGLGTTRDHSDLEASNGSSILVLLHIIHKEMDKHSLLTK